MRSEDFICGVRGRAMALLCISLVLAAAGPDDSPTDIGTVRATGGPGSNAPPAPETAPAEAPSQPPLDASQPTSVIDSNAIRTNSVATENYDNIIKFSPSVQNVDPTGAGLQQNFMETIRGFRYTQFNSTFDGLVLPGTISSFAPQTGAYFLAHDIASVSVDRGPGTASQIGYATFGGTVAATLATPSDTFGVNSYTTFGSWGTSVLGTRIDSGAIPELNGARAMLDSEHVEGDGYLTGTSTLRNNFFTNIQAPISNNTVISFVGMYDYARTHTPYGATLNQLQTFGANYALNNDPNSQAFTGHNVDNYYTDFDYVGVKSNLGDGWAIDNKTYTISYYHNGLQGLDPNGTKPNLVGTYYLNGVKTTLNGDVPGLTNHSDFRDYGNVVRVSNDTRYGQLRFGLWLDYSAGSSYKANVDLSDYNETYVKSVGTTPFKTLYNTTLTTVQPYVEFAAKPLPNLTVTPGLKFTYVDRGLDATIIGSAPATAPSGESWTALQPSVDAHYAIMPDWVAYAQVAKGFLAPPLNTLLVSAANAPTSLKPQDTMNYQIGTTFKTDRFVAGLDAYYIQFQNYIASQTSLSNGGTIYTNNGDATFKGIELEGTAKVYRGLAVYGNATLNDATYDSSGFPVALNPTRTAALGPIVQQNEFFGSFLWKYVGPQYLQDGAGPSVHAVFPIKSYTDADLALGYHWELPQLNHRALDFKFNLLNVFNDHSLTGLFGTTSAGAALYATNPGRGAFFSVSASL